MSDNLLNIYEGMLQEAKDAEEVEEKEEEIDEGKGLGPGKGKGDGKGDGSGTCEEEEEEVSESAADMKLVKKVQDMLDSADKTTLMTIAKWIGSESDKVK